MGIEIGMDDPIDDWDPIMLEYPFVRTGMTLREYFKEKEYYYNHIKEVKSGEYSPLWRQKEQNN